MGLELSRRCCYSRHVHIITIIMSYAYERSFPFPAPAPFSSRFWLRPKHAWCLSGFYDLLTSSDLKRGGAAFCIPVTGPPNPHLCAHPVYRAFTIFESPYPCVQSRAYSSSNIATKGRTHGSVPRTLGWGGAGAGSAHIIAHLRHSGDTVCVVSSLLLPTTLTCSLGQLEIGWTYTHVNPTLLFASLDLPLDSLISYPAMSDPLRRPWRYPKAPFL